jgi:integrase/recombinase XerD
LEDIVNQFGKFIQERKYLQKVSPRTLTWYAESFKWFGTENPTDDELKNVVIRMREKGLRRHPATTESGR